MDDFKQSYSVAPAPQRLVPYSRRWYMARITLRTLCFAFAAVVIGLANALKTTYYSTIYYRRQYSWRFVLPVGICALLYNLVELAVFAFRYNVRRGIHPGISVAGDLILWMTCFVAAFFNLIAGSFLWSGYMDMRPDELTDLDMANEVMLCLLTYAFSFVLPPPPSSSGFVFQRTKIATNHPNRILHFILFVRSCIETKQRNASKGEDLYVYMYTPGGGPPIPVLPMKEQGGDYNHNLHTDQQSEVGTEWGPASTVRHSVISPSVGVTERNTITSSVARAPSTIAPSMPTAPPSAYGMGDGFSGYQGPTDEVEAHVYHANYGQKEIIPNGRRR